MPPLRQVPAAEGSGEAPVQDQYHVLLAPIVGKAHDLTPMILKPDLWSRSADLQGIVHCLPAFLHPSPTQATLRTRA